jgi:MFS-type transporter involved in bile tolerance (Atg22 family)
MNSMVSQPAGAIGAIVLAALADGTSVTTAMVVGGIVCAVAAPLYIPAWRAEQARATVAQELSPPASEVSDSAA